MNSNTPAKNNFIPDDVIDQVKHIDIIDALSPYLTITKNGSGDEAICPFHDDHKPSLKIDQAHGRYKCFVCDKYGTNAIDVVMKVKSVEWYDAVRLIAGDHQISIPEKEMTLEEEATYKTREAIYIVNQWAADWFRKQMFTPENILVIDYVKSRWNDESIDAFGLGYAPDGWKNLLPAAKKEGYKEDLLLEAGLIKKKEKDGKESIFDTFRNRVIFPISDRRGIAAFTSRCLPDKPQDPKYLNTGDNLVYHKSNILYNLPAAARYIKDQANVYLVEGNADVIRLHQIGIYNCVAISGTSLTAGHIEALKKITPCITLIGDTDKAGQDSVSRSAKMIIESGMYCKIITLPNGEEKQDADSFFKDKATFDEYDVAPHKKDYILYLAEKEKNDHLEPDQKAGLISKITYLVLRLPTKSHDHYLAELGTIIPPKSGWKLKKQKTSSEESAENKDRNNSLREGSKNEKIEIYLNEKYIFRYNTIKCKSEYRKDKNEDWIPMDKVKLNSLKRELNYVDICSSTDNIKSILESDFSTAVDPIKEYFRGLPDWDQEDHISKLCSTIKTKNDQLFYKYFRKWIIGVIANALEDDSCKNHLCLVITGEQGKFKTSWLENLCPAALRTHYLYTGKIQPQNKDVLTLLAEYLFINIDDQLRQLNKIDENELKNLITINYVKYRRPYDPFMTEYPHLASFMASVNGNDFLTDISGSRRFLPFEAMEIKIDEAQKLNMDLVYSMAFHLYKSGERYWFNDEEISELHEYNEGFRVVSNEEELVLHYFDIPSSRTDATHFFNTTLIKTKLEQQTGQRLSTKKVGEAMTKLNFEKWQRRLANDAREKVWSVIEKTGTSISGENKTKMPF